MVKRGMFFKLLMEAFGKMLKVLSYRKVVDIRLFTIFLWSLEILGVAFYVQEVRFISTYTKNDEHHSRYLFTDLWYFSVAGTSLVIFDLINFFRKLSDIFYIYCIFKIYQIFFLIFFQIWFFHMLLVFFNCRIFHD